MLSSGAVFIGRPSMWGNPFKIGEHGTRDQVLAWYREYLLAQPQLLLHAKEYLKGKDLVCHCKPKACHGDVLIEIANSE